MTRPEALLVAALLGVFLLLAGAQAVQKSPTVDEFAHLPAGLHYLRTGDFSLYAKNPPLVKVLAALPLLAAGAEPGYPHLENADSSWRPWLVGDDFMRRNAARYHRLFVMGRAVILALGAALGLAIWRAARALHGPGGGIAALVLYCLLPDVLAHSALVTTDVGAALAIFLAVWALLGFLDRPGAGRGAVAGIALGAALLAKFTALLLGPLFLAGAAAAGLWHRARWGPGAPGFSWGRVAGGTALAAAAAWVVVAAGYGWQLSSAPLGAYPLHSELLGAVQAALPGLRLPHPPDFLVGLDAQLAETEHYGFPNFLLGRWYEGSRWEYFPVAVLVKTPLATLLAGIAGFLLWRRRPRGGGRPALDPREAALLAAAVTLALGIVLRNRIQIGVRYLIPAYPFALVLAGRIGSAELLRRGGRAYRALLAVGALVLLGSVLRTFPHHLSYFNLLAGGPVNGHHVLLDSNVDWGQDLPGLAAAMREHGDRSVQLAYFGHVDPGIYGIRFEPFTRAGRPGLTAISVTYLMGLDYPMTYTDPWRPAPLEEIARYRDRRPDGWAGRSIALFRD